MRCDELQAVLADDELNALSPEARQHLAGCSACRDLLADFSTIVHAAKSIPVEVNPPERIWVALRAQLEAEGIIREPEAAEELATAKPWWSGFAQFFRPRALATASVGILVVAGSIYLIEQKSNTPQVAVSPATVNTVNTTGSTGPSAPETPVAPVTSAKRHSAAVMPGHPIVPEPHTSTVDLRPSPSEDAYLGDSASVLNDTQNSLTSQKQPRNALVDAALRQNLRTLNDFIAECETRLKENPQDQMSREYLNMAYQQKAELLSAMMDSSVRSEH
jgi:hypothetical protein